ncbi:restriction endonuclease subunit S [Paraburkholderia sp. CNPSo 3076]|nr:restriction endonuclease subunit S [Paraburkholderia sp. CNPSo 3076]
MRAGIVRTVTHRPWALRRWEKPVHVGLRCDLLFTTEAPLGNIALVDISERFALAQRVICFQLHDLSVGPYLRFAMMSEEVQERLSAAASGMTATGIKASRLKELPIPIPPLAEQRRIVAKVGELMRLCDELETRGRLEAEQHARLTATLFTALAASESAHALAESWDRVAAHFDLLLDRTEAVDVLEGTIVQLAVRGLLVQADPNDEPVDALLNRIRSEKEPLATAGKIKRSTVSAETGEDDQPFEAPKHWAWCSLGELILKGPNNGYSPKPSPTETDVRCLSLSATTQGYFKEDCFKFVDIPVPTAEQYFLKSGDLLIQRANSLDYVGIAAIYDREDDLFMYPDLMMRLRLSTSVNVRYIHAYLISYFGRQYFKGKATGTQGNMPKINQGVVVNMPIPIPPAAEQARIVAGLDQLRGLCTDLRQRLAERRTRQARLAEAMVEQATTAARFVAHSDDLAAA